MGLEISGYARVQPPPLKKFVRVEIDTNEVMSAGLNSPLNR